MTLDELVDLEETANESHNRMKELLLSAENDWPTSTDSISIYIEKVEQYFGAPTTKESIRSIKFNGKNAWQLESGESIIQFIEATEESFGTTSFRDSVNALISKLQQR